MSSAELTAPRGGSQSGLAQGVKVRVPGAPATVLTLLIWLILVAVFDHGAVDEAASARIEVAGALIALLAAAAGLWSGELRIRTSRSGGVALGLLLAFCAWSAVSLAWSVAPDRTWVEFNRTVLYLLCLGIAVACGASWRRAPEALASGLIAVGAAVCAYAIGQKLVPGVHIGRILNLDQTGAIPRLQEPLGYWNALALLLSLIAPLALGRAVDPARGSRSRLAHLLLLVLLLLTVALTLSRGGLIVLAIAFGVSLAAGGRGLRGLLWLVLAVLAATPALILGLSNHSLTSDDIALASRESAGLLLLAALAGGLLIGGFLALRLLGLEQRTAIAPATVRRIVRGLRWAGLAVVVAAALSIAVSGTISRTWHSFTATHAASVTQPSRLLSADSANRWVWWKEAAGAFSDRPLGGWGAGSFPVVHLLYRRDALTVNEAHSVPLQWLAETGIVGALFAGGAVLLLLAGAGAAVRAAQTPSDRAVRAGLAAAGAAFATHCLFDWGWDIPGVTMPALLCLGVLAGSAARTTQAGERPPRPRPLWLAILSAALCLGAISAAIPSLAASRARSALVAAAGASTPHLGSSAAGARLAGQLDPLSDAGPLAAATIALHEGQRQRARRDLWDAINREPSDPQAWADLSYVETVLGHISDARRAAQRARELDPLGGVTSSLAGALSATWSVAAAPPADSATASKTP
ncbi:MAG TPA: O-antigen ligase family protein [Solirubrobacteraceae bacterium]|nr:O-antigen ligase family protein [Solirubrobacteraceae bacterium]